MEEIKQLIEAVANLPHVALWVLAGYLVYKLAMIGSLYATIRFLGARLFDYLQARKTLPPVMVEVVDTFEGMCIGGESGRLKEQIQRVIGRFIHRNGLVGGLNYIHGGSVDWLKEAIDDKIKKDEGSVK